MSKHGMQLGVSGFGIVHGLSHEYDDSKDEKDENEHEIGGHGSSESSRWARELLHNASKVMHHNASKSHADKAAAPKKSVNKPSTWANRPLKRKKASGWEKWREKEQVYGADAGQRRLGHGISDAGRHTDR